MASLAVPPVTQSSDGQKRQRRFTSLKTNGLRHEVCVHKQPNTPAALWLPQQRRLSRGPSRPAQQFASSTCSTPFRMSGSASLHCMLWTDPLTRLTRAEWLSAMLPWLLSTRTLMHASFGGCRSCGRRERGRGAGAQSAASGGVGPGPAQLASTLRDAGAWIHHTLRPSAGSDPLVTSALPCCPKPICPLHRPSPAPW